MAVSLLEKHFSKIRLPGPSDKIYKDECIYSFDTPESETGLYVCMNTFLGFGRQFVELHHRKTGNAVFLRLRRIKHLIEERKITEEKKITKLAIGIEGGFDVDMGKKYEYEESNSIVILPDFVEIPLPCAELPLLVQQSVAAILMGDSASKMEEAQALAGTWDGEKRPVTKHAFTLQQLDNGVKIPPKGWQCELCEKRDNLWMNLTDGRILCGRRYFDGSGGNNHASEHYKVTGFPLAVKLGTITVEGGDVYSYEEDEMVEDPNLAQHLAHFGIDIAQMEKTDKSMIELEIDMNQRIGEWATIQEAGSKLVPLYGPGYTGLANLGNSCYLNSVMQVIFSIPEFQSRYAEAAQAIFETGSHDPIADFTIQMAKLGHGLLSGIYSKHPPPGSDPERDVNECQAGIKPTMFKSLIGKGHPEFSSKRQQDAQEFFFHLLNVLERNSYGQPNPADCFKFKGEERIQVDHTNKVKYNHTSEYILRVPIPLDSALNKDEVREYEAKKAEMEAKGQRMSGENIVRPRIPFAACIKTVCAPKIVQGFFNTITQANTNVIKTSRMATFPDYLMIQLERFTFDMDSWIPRKLDVSVDIPDELDLECLRGTGLQSNEELIPDEQPKQPAAPAFQFDENIIAQMVDMGFPIEACKRALFNVRTNSLEAAVNWVTEHIADPDIAAPFVVPGGGQAAPQPPPADPGMIEAIVGMGFTPDQAAVALRNTDNNVERAIDWIFSHVGELEAFVNSQQQQQQPASNEPHYRDGPPKYRLVAFISHMGTSTMVGHYVCHIFREGRWVIYNDNKVAVSENPPKGLGYLYLYKRV